MTHYSRDEWQARAPRATYDLDREDVDGIVLHWPAMSSPLGNVARVMSALRSWQSYHMDTLGWSDIGYQLAFDQAGNVYRLRGIQHRSGANGDMDVNERYLAFLLILAPGEKPSPAMLRRVRRYIKIGRRLYPNAKVVVGHNDVRPEPTACPGPIVTRLINEGAFKA